MKRRNLDLAHVVVAHRRVDPSGAPRHGSYQGLVLVLSHDSHGFLSQA